MIRGHNELVCYVRYLSSYWCHIDNNIEAGEATKSTNLQALAGVPENKRGIPISVLYQSRSILEEEELCRRTRSRIDMYQGGAKTLLWREENQQRGTNHKTIQMI